MSTDSPSTTDRLAEIRARRAAVTAAPWVYESGTELHGPGAEHIHYVTEKAAAADDDPPLCSLMFEQDARFIANAPDDIDRLLSLVDSLQERLDTAEGRLARHAERHKPTEVFLEWHEFPVQSSKRTVCSGCSDFEAAQYQLWPCPEAVAFGLGEEPSDV